MRSLFLITESRYNKDDLFVKGFSYHTTSQEQAIACIIPPGSIVKKSLTSAPDKFCGPRSQRPEMATMPRTFQIGYSHANLHAPQPHPGGNRRVVRRLPVDR